MTTPHRPFDPGLQPERTLLAWRRTAAGLAVGSLAAVRVLYDSLQVLALLGGAVGLVAAAGYTVIGHRRHRRFMAAVAEGRPPVPASGAPLAAATALILMCGLVALVGLALQADRS